MSKNKNILEQEEEFLKLNSEIELETKALMIEVDQIKKFQTTDWTLSDPSTLIESIDKDQNIPDATDDDFALTEYYLRQNNENSIDDSLKKEECKKITRCNKSAKVSPTLVGAREEEETLALAITKPRSDLKAKEDKNNEEFIPESLKGAGRDGITRFLSAKVKLLTEQLDIMRKDEKKHLEKIKELQSQKEKFLEEREKFLQQANMSKNVLVKFEKHTNNITAQLQTCQTENSHLRKELETLRKEFRQKAKNYNANEIKLNRTLEEVERLKAALQQTRQEEKEFKEIQRKKIEEVTSAVKVLERQRMELLNGFKKQLVVIDNLKRQKALMEAGKLLKTTEEDFINFLECNPPTTVRRVEGIKSAKFYTDEEVLLHSD